MFASSSVEADIASVQKFVLRFVAFSAENFYGCAWTHV